MAEPVWITFDMFEGRVGERFELSGADGQAVSSELLEAVETTEPGGTGPAGQHRTQFSLVFRGPLEPALPQATYAVEHDELGHLDLFLVPIGRDDTGMRYQAVFA